MRLKAAGVVPLDHKNDGGPMSFRHSPGQVVKMLHAAGGRGVGEPGYSVMGNDATWGTAAQKQIQRQQDLIRRAEAMNEQQGY